jgi:hypothetical protein
MTQPVEQLPTAAYANLLVVSATAPAVIERQLEEMGLTPSTVGVIPIAESDREYNGPLHTTETIAPDDLTGLSMRFTTVLDALSPAHGWVVFEALTEMLMYTDVGRVCRFIDHVADQTRAQELRGVYPVARKAIADDTYARLAQQMDTEIDRVSLQADT